MTERTAAQGHQSVAIGGNVQGSTVVTGDLIFQWFSQAPVSLSAYIRVAEFQTLIRERTRDFIGRGFIFDAIAAALQDPQFNSGYVVIRGEPGIGKTALMAELVRRQGCVHHFNIAPQNIRSPRQFLENVSAQLIVRYGLAHPVLPPDAAQNSGFLSRLLAEASASDEARPVVVLVDALDEAEDAGLPSDANRLFLPRELPDQVFFVVTTREEHDPRLDVERERTIYLRDDDPQNLEDVRAYLLRQLAEHAARLTPQIAHWRVSPAEFVEILTDKSQGNFMYLVHVLRDIAAGKLTAANVDDIRNLPAGLRSYYQRHWRLMREQDRERFEKYYEPVVCQLAVAREPVTVSQIAEWTNLPALRVREVFHEWREFLNESLPEGGESLYRIYHASFQDFLREEVGLAPYHQAIIAKALDKIPGFGAAI